MSPSSYVKLKVNKDGQFEGSATAGRRGRVSILVLEVYYFHHHRRCYNIGISTVSTISSPNEFGRFKRHKPPKLSDPNCSKLSNVFVPNRPKLTQPVQSSDLVYQNRPKYLSWTVQRICPKVQTVPNHRKYLSQSAQNRPEYFPNRPKVSVQECICLKPSRNSNNFRALGLFGIRLFLHMPGMLAYSLGGLLEAWRSRVFL